MSRINPEQTRTAYGEYWEQTPEGMRVEEAEYYRQWERQEKLKAERIRAIKIKIFGANADFVINNARYLEGDKKTASLFNGQFRAVSQTPPNMIVLGDERWEIFAKTDLAKLALTNSFMHASRTMNASGLDLGEFDKDKRVLIDLSCRLLLHCIDNLKDEKLVQQLIDAPPSPA